MTCKNCGAPIDASALTCPYCGFENEAAATRVHERELRGIYAQIARIFHLPAERARKVTNALIVVVIALVAVFIVALIGSFIYSRITPDLELERQQTIVAEMEELYLAGDYDALSELVEDTDNVYRAVYDKYTTVHFLYQYLVSLEQSAPETAEFIAGYPEGADLLDYELDNAFYILAECNRLEANGFVYGEQTAVAEFRARATSVLTDTLLLTDTEIADGVAIAAEVIERDDYDYEPDWSTLRDLSASRLSGGAE